MRNECGNGECEQYETVHGGNEKKKTGKNDKIIADKKEKVEIAHAT